MKKKIIIGAFLLLILITAIASIVSAINSYNYDMDPANGVDIMPGLSAAMFIALGVLIVFYQLDLFYTVYYFFIKPKTIAKSILNVLCNLNFVLIFFSGYIASGLSISEETHLTIAFIFIYLILRSVYVLIATKSSDQET